MNKRILVTLAVVLLASGWLLGNVRQASASFTGTNNDLPLADTTGYGHGNGSNGSGSSCSGTLCESTSLSSTPLSDSEKESLLFMVEEEKLARDVYQFLAEKWDLAIFSNIAQSEQAHMDAVITLIERYGLTNPVSASAGTFSNTDLQALYTQLTEKGSQSLTDALLTGGAIEEIDIRDLNTRLANVTHNDIAQVFTNLEKGSYNHLQAFTNEYELQTGDTYTPQYLDAATYQQAIETDRTTGNTSSMGYMGNGQGRMR